MSYGLDFEEIKKKLSNLMMSPTERKIQELEALKSELIIKKRMLETETRRYMIKNMPETICLFAIGATAVVFVSEELNLSEDIKAALAVSSIGCAVYLVVNYEKTADVLEKYVYYANEINQVNNLLREIDYQINVLKGF